MGEMREQFLKVVLCLLAALKQRPTTSAAVEAGKQLEMAAAEDDAHCHQLPLCFFPARCSFSWSLSYLFFFLRKGI